MAAIVEKRKFLPAFELPGLSARHVLANWKLFALVNLPLFLLIALELIGANNKEEDLNLNASDGEIAAFLGVGIGVFALIVLVYIVFYSMLIRLALNTLTGKKTTTDQLVETAKKYSLRLIGLVIVTTVIVVAGLILLIIPGIILAVMLSMAPYIMIDKDKGITDSLKESFDLVKENTGPFLAAFGVFLLLNIGLSVFGNFSPYINAIASVISVLFLLIPIIRYLEIRKVKISEPKAS